MKNHKMLLELVRKEKTEHGAVPLKESSNLMIKMGELAKKLGYDCFVKGYPKNIADYEPTNKEFHIKKLEDIAKLSPEQFEMFIEDLRNWCNIQRGVDALSGIGLDISSEEGMIRLDTGKHEEIIKVEANITNKI